jgi:NTP pyrophosphatase (non-canonical NTP hydrolase)
MKLTKIKEVEQWATERGLYEGGDSKTQHVKFIEELGELARAVIKNNVPDKIDAIGDCVVVLINYCKLERVDINDVLYFANRLEIDFKDFHSILDEKDNVLLASKASKDFPGLKQQEAVCSTLVCLNEIAKKNETTLEACLDAAYEVIKNRKGKMENGSFIKNEE